MTEQRVGTGHTVLKTTQISVAGLWACPPASVTVLHAHYANPGEVAAGHVPGAVGFDLRRVEDPLTYNVCDLATLRRVLLAHGVVAESRVVVTARQAWPGAEDYVGLLAAYRLAWVLWYAGVRWVGVLDGGVEAWGRAGYGLSRTVEPVRGGDDFGNEAAGRPGVLAAMDEVRGLGPGQLVSVCSWAEYVGAVSGYDYIQARGRIPGALFGGDFGNRNTADHLRNADGTMRSVGEIGAYWAAQGVRADRRVVFYCGTGWRAAEAWWAARRLGWHDVAVYDGGWFEWSRDKRNAIEVG